MTSDSRTVLSAASAAGPEVPQRKLTGAHALRHMLTRQDFRRLLATRIFAQWSDGIFQASLAGAVLFNPQRAAEPADIAASFAILLLPYSVLGPFVGVLLDRWSRQAIMIWSNAVRAGMVVVVGALIFAGIDGWLFYLTALLTISINRFFLSALSAALPHVVDEHELVSANAFTTTIGTIVGVIGGGTALGVRALVGTDNHGYAVIAACAALGYLFSAYAVSHFRRDSLGPDDVERAQRTTLRIVFRGMIAGGRHIAEQPPTLAALLVISAHRLMFGASTIIVLLLFRNYFPAGPIVRNGLTGVGQALGTVAIGSLVAALITPAITRRIGKPAWVAIVLPLAGVAIIGFGLPSNAPLLLVAAFFLGIVAQAAKICADTTVQENVEDDYRGRVFSVYDTLFNMLFVAGAVAAALLLPADGRSALAIVFIGIAYVLSGAIYALVARRSGFPR